MKRLILSLALVALLAGTSLGATYVVNYAAHAPTGPSDAIWGTASAMTPIQWIDGGAPATGADFSVDVRYLWDGTNLYGRVMVTDNVHYNTAADPPTLTNQWNMDEVEFYVNAVNRTTAGAVFTSPPASMGLYPGCTQDDWGINNNSNLVQSGTQIGSTISQIIVWRDTAFDATGTVNNTTGGTYGVQSTWVWTTSSSSGGLGLSATPTAGQLMCLGGAAVDADGTAGRIHHGITTNYAGAAAITWNDPSTFGGAQLAAAPLPNPTVASATDVNLTHVKVLFAINSSATTMDPASAGNAANYALDNSASVLSAALQSDGKTVALTTTTLTKGTTYHLTVSNVQDAVTNPINPNPSLATFAIAPATPPTVVSASASTATTVVVGFSIALDPVTAASASNYAIAGVTVSGAALGADGKTVILTTSAMTANTSYTVTVTGVQNTLRDTIGAGNTGSFIVPPANLVPGLIGNYYKGFTPNNVPVSGTPPLINYAGLTRTNTTIDTTINFNVATGLEFRPDLHWTGYLTSFAVNWTGYIYLPVAGTYQFSVQSDDGSIVEVNGVRVVADDGVHPMRVTTGTAVTEPAGYLPISVGYFQAAGGAGMILSYIPPGGTAPVVVPASALFHAAVVTPSPSANYASFQNATHVNVGFGLSTTATSLDSATAANPASYVLDNGAAVTGAVLQPDGVTVQLTTSTLSPATTYHVTVTGVNDSAGLTISPNPATLAFTTPTAPTVTSATVTSNQTTLVVNFSKAMSSATLTNVANYSISGGVSVTAATTSANGVTLTVSGMTLGGTYTLSVSNVQDTVGMTITPNPSTATFTSRTVLLVYTFPTLLGNEVDGVSYSPSSPVAANLDQTAAGTALTHMTWGAGLPAGHTSIADPVDGTGVHYTTEPVCQVHPNSAALAANTSIQNTVLSVTSSCYMQFGVQPIAGYKLVLSTLEFDVAKGNTSTPRGVGVESSIDGFGTATTQILYSSDIASNRPAWTHVTVDLSAAKFQNLTGPITFRLYFYTPSTTQSIEFDNVTLYGAVLASGPQPTVAITSPTGPYTTAIGSSVTFTASVTITNSAATFLGIKFFDGATLLGSGGASGGNYTYQWSTIGQAAGNHNITAVVSDTSGGQGTSAITVVNLSTSTPPSVTLRAPADGLIAGQGYPIALSATTTSGTPNAVTGVDFYFNGNTSMGHGTLVSTGVYSCSWDSTSAPLGTLTVVAKVTDGGGLTATSGAIYLTIRIPADGNGDNIVDGEDYGIWQNGYNHPGATMLTGDYNGDGIVDGEDYGVWQNNYNRTASLSDVVAASSADVASTPMAGSAAPRLISVTPTAGTVALVFDTDVIVGGSAVEVTGLVGGPQAYTAAYDAATKTLTLTFASALPADTYTVRVIGSFVVAADGGASLDGDAQARFSRE